MSVGVSQIGKVTKQWSVVWVENAPGELLRLICAGYVPLASQSSYPIIVCSADNREEKSLRHVAMVAKFLDDN